MLPRCSVSGPEDLAREGSGQVSLCSSPARFLSPSLHPSLSPLPPCRHHAPHRCPQDHPRPEATLQTGPQLSINCQFSWH